MAELTDGATLDPDHVVCHCGQQWDRNIYAQCANCGTNLWDLDRGGPQAPPQGPHPCSNTTVLEADSQGTAGIDILVCGRRLTIADGQTLRLGRREDFETAAVFSEAKNVSREHATLRFAGGKLYVTDTLSSNRTFVDGQPLPPGHEYEIRRGQALRLASNVAVEILWEGR